MSSNPKLINIGVSDNGIGDFDEGGTLSLTIGEACIGSELKTNTQLSIEILIIVDFVTLQIPF
ncbi:hypothetical protein GCM10007855_13400 [Aliivibrio sifiae]|uniref:Uncharacterized protein n=1 Tax=Aliivibrio sifiae TaxID=566293 RepID=A0ABQ6ADX6_9GAMM|nr:hypothetical protein GCM10007855_13400 [Aliivibrio sifiae]